MIVSMLTELIAIEAIRFLIDFFVYEFVYLLLFFRFASDNRIKLWQSLIARNIFVHEPITVKLF